MERRGSRIWWVVLFVTLTALFAPGVVSHASTGKDGYDLFTDCGALINGIIGGINDSAKQAN